MGVVSVFRDMQMLSAYSRILGASPEMFAKVKNYCSNFGFLSSPFHKKLLFWSVNRFRKAPESLNVCAIGTWKGSDPTSGGSSSLHFWKMLISFSDVIKKIRFFSKKGLDSPNLLLSYTYILCVRFGVWHKMLCKIKNCSDVF